MVNLLVSLHDKFFRIGKMRISPRKLFRDWKLLMIMLCHINQAQETNIVLCYIHQAQETNTCPRSTIETLEQGVKHNQSCQ